MKTLVRSIARRLLGPYAMYRIYEHREPPHPPPAAGEVVLAPIRGVEELALSPDPDLRELADYGGEGSFGFEARVDGELVAACWYWAGERYRTRNFWPLGDDEAKRLAGNAATANRPAEPHAGFAGARRVHS